MTHHWGETGDATRKILLLTGAPGLPEAAAVLERLARAAGNFATVVEAFDALENRICRETEKMSLFRDPNWDGHEAEE